jgi:hypothetical protein
MKVNRQPTRTAQVMLPILLVILGTCSSLGCLLVATELTNSNPTAETITLSGITGFTLTSIATITYMLTKGELNDYN